jgi:hypothetical protein
MEISPINGDLKLQKRRSGHRLWESLWIPIVLDIRDCFRCHIHLHKGVYYPTTIF